MPLESVATYSLSAYFINNTPASLSMSYRHASSLNSPLMPEVPAISYFGIYSLIQFYKRLEHHVWRDFL